MSNKKDQVVSKATVQMLDQWEERSLYEWCSASDVEVRIISSGQYRLTKGIKKIDIYPQGGRWHNLKDNSRGTFKNWVVFVTEHFK